MSVKVSFRRDDRRIKIVNGKDEVDLFQVVADLSVREAKRNLNNGMLNVVYLSSNVYEQVATKKPYLFNESMHLESVFPVEDPELEDNEIKLCLTLRSIFGFHEGEDNRVALALIDELDVKKTSPQWIEGIREDNVHLSSIDYQNFIAREEYKNIHLFEVTNTITGDTVVIKKTHFIEDKTLKEGVIRLNRKQRIFLGLTLISFISDIEWNYLTKHNFTDPKGNNYEDIITKVYSCSGHTKDSSLDYDMVSRAEKALESIYNNPLVITPVVESFHVKGKSNLFVKIANFYAGKSTITLQCKRPYDIDEGSDIVRMSKTNMSLLGVSEMDQVVITYKNKKTKCKVLELKDGEQYRYTNRPFPIDFVIGIPTAVRKRIGVTDINSAIKIDRDTPFILRKTINEQIVPSLITLAAALIVTDFSKIWAAVVAIIALPIVLWINLSKYRNARNKLRK